MNPLLELKKHGQSVWLDYIRRTLIGTGELKRLVDEDGLAGVTSNPSIFEKAISGSTDYVAAISDLAGAGGDAKSLYEKLALEDIRGAADALSSVYASTSARDGYVSLEVSPHLAHDTEGTCEEARRLWKALGRPNVMIKVPGTKEGIPAIERLIGEGINVNVTLLFSLEAYEKAANAYIGGVEKLVASGGDPKKIASVASFFVSRMDTAVDRKLDDLIASARNDADRTAIRGLLGKAAVANAVLAYELGKKIFSGPRWQPLAKAGAGPQRLLWASTSTKNPKYRDVVYVEELVGPRTVNTMPPATMDAFRDHGRVEDTLEKNPAQARDVLKSLEARGISMAEVTDGLLADGLRLFSESFDKLLAAVDKARNEVSASAPERTLKSLPGDLAGKVEVALEDWEKNSKVRRLWARDATVWTGADEASWLGWLGIADDQAAHVSRFSRIAEEAKGGGYTHLLLLGMGGSSLCPEVMRMTFGKIPGFPEMHVLDSTDPAQIRAFEKKIDLTKTLFVVSSKSGSTLEPNIFKQYFFEKVKQALGEKTAPRRFVAITDPGSKLEKLAESEGFYHTFHGLPSIGGRYSALSDFGMVPAAGMGVDMARFLDRTEEMVHACASCVPPRENPGVVLGAILGTAGVGGRDKVTIVTSPGIWDLGAWLEQLLAESTGKVGKALVPVDGERLGPPRVYGNDRVFCYLRLEDAPDAGQDKAVDALEKAGHPVVRIPVAGAYDVGREFFRWEIATAVAGSILGINPFNQPDVEASKIATRKLTTEYEEKGSLPAEKPILEGDGMKLYTDARNAKDLGAQGGGASVKDCLGAHLARLGAGDYLALLAYVEMNDETKAELQAIRHAVRDRKRVATCLGFGPRFLHSTGQAYKGGPNTGVFLQITCDDAEDLRVPGQKYTFGVVKAAQARGDFEVLLERDRRALRVHLGSDPVAGLRKLRAMVDEVLPA